MGTEQIESVRKSSWSGVVFSAHYGIFLCRNDTQCLGSQRRERPTRITDTFPNSTAYYIPHRPFFSIPFLPP
jgi:hypothetical protein